MKLSYTIRETTELSGIGRSAIYKAISEGRLRAVKCGRRTLLLARDVQGWLDGLPPAKGAQ